MSRSQKTNNTKTIISLCITIMGIVTILLVYSNPEIIKNIQGENSLSETNTIFVNADTIENIELNNEKLNIIFFYVGQADCTFIKLNDKSMIIDAGNNEDGKLISDYLKNLGINKINYIIGTHADEDHIGGLDDIIKNFETDNIYMPKIGNDSENYKDIIKAAKNKDLEISNPNIGDKFQINNAQCEILSVMNEGDASDNNSSIVIQMNYGETKYLFMGDAEKQIENSIKWNKVDVLKVGHHGSGTSSNEKFLEQVKPHYAVIQVGQNNKYRLPNKNTIERLESIGAEILRTDTNCTSFLITSDGTTIEKREVKINLDGNAK